MSIYSTIQRSCYKKLDDLWSLFSFHFVETLRLPGKHGGLAPGSKVQLSGIQKRAAERSKEGQVQQAPFQTVVVSVRKPRKPLDVFMNQIYMSVRRDHPKLSKPAIRIICREKWKRMCPKQRAPYESICHRDRERYHAELRARGIPRSPCSPQNYFTRDRYPGLRAERPGLKTVELMQLICDEWRTVLSEEKRREYRAMAESDRRRYYEEVRRNQTANDKRRQLLTTAARSRFTDQLDRHLEARWCRLLEIPPNDGTTKFIVSRRRKMETRHVRYGMPRYPTGPFFLFCAEEYGKRNESDVKNHSKAAARSWSTLSAAQRQKYFDQHAQSVQTYHQKLAEWKREMIADGKQEVLELLLGKVAATPYRIGLNRRKWCERRNKVMETVLKMS